MKYTIVVDKQSRTNPSNEKRETTFDIDELRKKGDIHDDFIIEDGRAKVIRRIGITKYNVTSVLDNEVTEDLGQAKIALFEGDNYIYIKDEYNNQMCAEYIVKSDFTDMYVTKVQMNSAIEQTAQGIDLSVSKKLEGYSTAKEMKSAIEMTEKSIISTVREKVGKNEVISEINQSTEAITINANKINLSRKRN